MKDLPEVSIGDLLDKTRPWKRLICWLAGHTWQNTCLVSSQEAIDAQICLRCGHAFDVKTKERIYFPPDRELPEEHRKELAEWYAAHPEAFPEGTREWMNAKD